MRAIITQERLKELLRYEPDTGHFYWRFERRGKGRLDRPAGTTKDASGRIQIRIDQRCYRAHRLAWLYVHGEFPPPDKSIDHINRDASDNRLANLRLATPLQQQGNRGANQGRRFKGISPNGAGWQARLTVDGRCVHVGQFATPEEAARAYDAAAIERWGEFAHTNFPPS